MSQTPREGSYRLGKGLTLKYHILPINHTVRVEVRKIFCRRGVGNHQFYRFFMTVTLAVPPLTMKNMDVRLIGHVPLIG